MTLTKLRHYIQTVTGLFNYRYLTTFVLLLTSFIAIGASALHAEEGYIVEPTQTTFTGSIVTLNWSAPTDRTIRTGWIAIYKLNAPDSQYKQWGYINSYSNSGTVTLSNVEPGTYQARLFSGSGFDRLASSPTFTVGSTPNPDPDPDPVDPNPDPEDPVESYTLTLSSVSINPGGSITVTIKAPVSVNSERDWVGLYKVGSTNQQYIDWSYLGRGTSRSVIFAVSDADQYEFRYFENDSYDVKVISSPLTVAISVAQCSVSNLNQITNYPPSNGPIIAFGDSLTFGVGASTGQDYVSQLSRKAGVNIVNSGVSGDTTRDALARLDRDVISQDPSVVIVWLGGNDILQRYYDRVRDGVENPGLLEAIRLLILRISGKLPNSQGITENETFENLREVIERVQSNGAIVIVIGFSGGVFDANLENRYRTIANETNAIYVPNALQSIIGRPSLMSDLVHPNNIGYGLVADRVLPYLACVIENK